MFGDGSLTFQEFAIGERLPLATIHDAVLEFLKGRDDAVLFGAQAVNAYSDDPRMTQDVGILSTRAEGLADEIRRLLNERFMIAARIRTIRGGIGYRIDQVRKPKNRHLVDVRAVEDFPPCSRVEGVLIPTLPELICQKVLSMTGRANTRKGFLDAADLRGLLVKFPELKTEQGPVNDALQSANASEAAIEAWRDLVAQEILPEDEDAGY